MSKRDILTICTLAAHLAVRRMEHGVRVEHQGHPVTADIKPLAGQAAAIDALRLQRLGRRARNNEAKRSNIKDYYQEDAKGLPNLSCRYYAEAARIGIAALEILQFYGLHPTVGGKYEDGFCLHIVGLPDNTLAGDDGFGI